MTHLLAQPSGPDIVFHTMRSRWIPIVVKKTSRVANQTTACLPNAVMPVAQKTRFYRMHRRVQWLTKHEPPNWKT